MISLLIITVFIAEIIIATFVISNLIKFDNVVISYNREWTLRKIDVITLIRDFRVIIQDGYDAVCKVFDFLRKKHEEYVLNMLKSAVMSLAFVLLRGKYKKILLAIQLALIMHETYSEALST